MLQEINKCIINLPERVERLENAKKELAYLFQDTSFNLIEGVKAANPMLGIAEAHLNCIRLAKANNWPHVLIMEDDVYFQAKEKTLPYVKNAFNHLPDNWDILLGGIYESKYLTGYNRYWNITSEFCGLHFYIVNNSAYDRILTYDGKYHIDRWINMDNKLKCCVTEKFFALQKEGYSDNVNARVNYSDKLVRFGILK